MTRLMCSSDRTEVEWVKQQLFRAGIRSQIRNNPVAQALRVARLELWVQDDCDFLKASQLYASVKPQAPDTVTAQVYHSGADEPRQPILDVEEVRNEVTPAGEPARGRRQRRDGELKEATRLLEKEIDDLLARETELAEKCRALETKVEELALALAQCQTELAGEIATCAAAEKAVAEVTGSRRALEAELSELGLRLKAREEAVLRAEAKAEALEQQLRSYVGSLGALYGRLHGKNSAGPGVRPKEQP